ncbi:MAG: folylpolyglutamate synthase/dihydrofolate synthase family protein [Candidatus Omnitrophota bacterium]
MQAYEDTLKYLDSLINYEKSGFSGTVSDFDLGKLKTLLEKMGGPHCAYRSVHVAGTKGKGSVCVFVSSVLKAAGYRVGLFTSPHLVTVRERIAIDNEIISREDFTDVVNRLRKYLGPRDASEFTYFEVLTLAAILYFNLRKVDYAVFETGMGGRLDATNIIDAEVCGISPISYDHTHVLGDSIEKIAREKAGIIKKRSHCVISPQRDTALNVIKKKCREEEASLTLVGEDITCRNIRLGKTGSRFDVRGKKGNYKDCRINMPGHFQPDNCAAAIGICEELFAGSESVEEAAVKKGIENAFLPGRLEILSQKPLMVIDGAQNEESALRLKISVEKIFKYGKLILVLGISKDKDIKGVCRQLAPLADEIVITKAVVERAADPLVVRGYIKGTPARVTYSVKEALGAALAKAGKNDMILVTGSFYVVGEVRKLIYNGSRVSLRSPGMTPLARG